MDIMEAQREFSVLEMADKEEQRTGNKCYKPTSNTL